MHQSVSDAFYDFNKPLEAEVSWMYLDILGKVTVGVGNLIDTPDAAAALPFIHGDDASHPATDDEKRQAWQALKARQDLAQSGYTACAQVSDLRLQSSDIHALVNSKLADNERILVSAFPQFASWPADGQLGLLSMAWAMGPGFPSSFPNFSAACQQMDFLGAASQCKMDDSANPGLTPRNAADVTLFTNAARVIKLGTANGYSLETLYFPTVILDQVVITGDAGSAPQDAGTSPQDSASP